MGYTRHDATATGLHQKKGVKQLDDGIWDTFVSIILKGGEQMDLDNERRMSPVARGGQFRDALGDFDGTGIRD